MSRLRRGALCAALCLALLPASAGEDPDREDDENQKEKQLTAVLHVCASFLVFDHVGAPRKAPERRGRGERPQQANGHRACTVPAALR